MTAEAYLDQIAKLESLIRNKKIEYDQWLDLAYNIASSWGESTDIDVIDSKGSLKLERHNTEKVKSSSRNNQPMANAIDNSLEIAEKTAKIIDDYINQKKAIIKTIEQLPEPEYDVLHKVYLQHKSFKVVASERNISHSWATALHARALKLLDDILREREKVD